MAVKPGIEHVARGIAAAAMLSSLAVAADDPLLVKSRAIGEAFGTRLQTALKTALAEGGPAAAVSVCKDIAPRIASELSRGSGAKVSRTSLKIRNPANAPEPWQARVLREFEAQAAAADATERLEYFQRDAAPGARYMKAIRTGPLCLMCHGSALSHEVRATLDRHYPFDRARGYEPGDIRGAFSITWPDTEAVP